MPSGGVDSGDMRRANPYAWWSGRRAAIPSVRPFILPRPIYISQFILAVILRARLAPEQMPDHNPHRERDDWISLGSREREIANRVLPPAACVLDRVKQDRGDDEREHVCESDSHDDTRENCRPGCCPRRL